MVHKQTQKSGFTIVELLIVIVVIGILAAITIVAYNGVQQRANNLNRTTAAKEWQKLIIAYHAQNGQYPSGTLNNHICLGTGNPTDFDLNADEDCNGTGNIKHPITSVNNAYASIVGKLPSFPGTKLTSASTGTVAGLSIRSYETSNPGTAEAKTQHPMLHYWMEGNDQDCILRPVMQYVSGGLTPSTNSFTANDAGLTRCVILMPHPSEI